VVVNVPAQLRRRRHLNDDPARRQRKIWVTSALVAALVLLAFLGSCSGRTAIIRRLPPGRMQ
jgi:hypothetical protein